MRQTVLSVVLEVAPESAGRLSALIETLTRDEEVWHPGDTELYSRLKLGVPTLHFMSISVFQDSHYDPIFVIEANFDGKPGPFWAQLEETLGQYLRPMLRCCKRPSDSAGPLYDAVTAVDSRYPVAPYLESRGRWSPVRFIRVTGGSSGTGFWARASSSWRREPHWRRPTPRSPIRTAA